MPINLITRGEKNQDGSNSLHNVTQIQGVPKLVLNTSDVYVVTTLQHYEA